MPIRPPMRPSVPSIKLSYLLKRMLITAFAAVVILVILYFFVIAAPKFKSGEVVMIIEPGQSIRSIANELRDDGLVRSSTVTQSLVILFGGQGNTRAGTYIFKEPQNVFAVARRIVEGDYGFIPTKLTVPEGTDSAKLAVLVHAKFSGIDAASFESLARAREGYLFPETYFFPPIEMADGIIRRMSETFDEKIAPYEEEIKNSGRTREEIIKMASILEAEVQTDNDRKLVADLLWRRLDNGMALQVDSTLGYVLNKTSAELTSSDLRSENAYNSYTNKGLPPTPISNPGINSIEAALRPIANDYLFYLSDKNGITHFSKTYEEHLTFKKKYIK